MSYLWIYVAFVVGGAVGFFLCAILSANNLALNWGKERIIIYHLDGVVSWITKGGGDIDRTMREIVRRVYDGKRTIHKNPIGKKPADKYPTSER